MFSFIDENGYKVELSFHEGPFEIEPKHVLVLVQKDNKWLCAINKKRGVEFPGGKVEDGESLLEAAKREVYEETLVHIKDIKWFAYYVVHDQVSFCKAVFTGKVERIDPFIEEHETSGVVWLTTEQLLKHSNLSFYMKDEGMKKMLQEVTHHERQW